MCHVGPLLSFLCCGTNVVIDVHHTKPLDMRYFMLNFKCTMKLIDVII